MRLFVRFTEMGHQLLLENEAPTEGKSATEIRSAQGSSRCQTTAPMGSIGSTDGQLSKPTQAQKGDNEHYNFYVSSRDEFVVCLITIMPLPPVPMEVGRK